MQTKAFTKWANSHLKVKGIKMDDITKDLSSGLNLCYMLASMTGETVKPPNSTKKLAKKTQREIRSLENINKALAFIQKKKGINLEGLIGSRNIYEGDVTMILGLVWTLILRLQIQAFELDGVAGEKGLLLWCQRVTKGYHKGGSAIKNFSRSWKPALPFVAIIHHFRPDLIEFDKDMSNKDACESAFSVAESLGIPRILDVEDICDTPVPDKKIVMTYVAEYFKKFAVMEAADSKARAVSSAVKLTQRHEQLMADYETVAGEFQDEVSQQVTTFEDRDFGNSVESVQAKIQGFYQYAKEDKPKQQGKLLTTGNLLGSLHASQSQNGRPSYEPKITQDVLKDQFKNLESASTEYEIAMNDILAKYIQYRLVVEQFNGRANMAENVVADMNKMFDNFDDSDVSINNLTACLAAYKKYVQTMSRYEVILNALPALVEEVKEPYCDAATIRQRHKDLLESVEALKAKAEKFNKTANDNLEEIKKIRDLLSQYRSDASNLDFEARTLLQKAEAMRLGDSEKLCEDQLLAHASIRDQLPELEKELDDLRGRYGELDKVGRTGDLPEHLRIQALENQLKELADAIAAKKKALEDALAAEKAKAAAKAAELGSKHADLISKYESVANSIKEWIANKHQLFSADVDVTTVEGIQSINDDFKTYRGEEKPGKQKELFTNQDTIGQLRTSQRQNGMELFEPAAEITPKALAKAWSEMEKAEVGYEDTIGKILSSYKDQRRFTAEHDKKAKSINDFVKAKETLFTSKGTEVPSSDRVATLEERVKDHFAYEREVGRLGRTIDKMQKLADSVHAPYESDARIDAAQSDTSAAVKRLAEIAKDFGEKNKALLAAEEDLARKGKQYNNDAEGFLFLGKFVKEVLSEDVDPETSERAAQYLGEHKEFAGDTIEPLKKEYADLQTAAEELNNADRADYINDGCTPEQVTAVMDEVKALEAARADKLQAQLEKCKNDEEALKNSVAGVVETQTKSYNATAATLKDWMATQKAKFGVTDFRTVNDCEDASQQLEEYRATPKPTHQASLLSLDGILGTLHSLQRANSLELFEPEDELAYARMMATWDELNEAEAAYEKTLLDTTDAYKRMRNCVDEFNGTNELISKWADGQSEYFAVPVPDCEAQLPPADRILKINERLQRHDTYNAQHARYEPVAGALKGLIEPVKEPYQDAAATQEALKALQDKLAGLESAANAFKKENDDLLAAETALQAKSTNYIRDAEEVLFDIQASVDEVNEPFHASGISSVEAEKTKNQDFLKGKGGPDSLGERVEALVPAHTELKSAANSEDKKLCPSEVEIQVLRDAASNLKALGDANSAKLDEALTTEQKREDAAKNFAVAANAFNDYCTKQHDAINGVTGDFDAKLAALRGLKVDIEGKEGDLANCYALQKECESAGVTVNPHTSATPPSLQTQYDELKKLAQRVEENTESAKAAEAASKLSPEQSRMLRRVFKQFDEDNSNSMSFDEFYQACNAMGLFIDEAKAKSLFQSAVGSGDAMSFDQYTAVMESQLTSGASKADVLAAFNELADGKAKIAKSKVKRFFSNDAPVFDYMKTHMPEGDYKAFTEDIFKR